MQNKYQQPESSMEQWHDLWVKMYYIKSDKALIMTQFSKDCSGSGKAIIFYLHGGHIWRNWWNSS